MDAAWYRDVNQFAVHTPWAHGLMRVFAVYGVGLFGLLVLAAWWYARYRPNDRGTVAVTVWTAVATFVAFGVNQPITHAVARPRPFVTLHGVEVLVPRTLDYSFPSDHAVVAGTVAAGLWIAAAGGSRAIRRIALVSTLLALFIAFARVYVGAHYPGDVAGGLAVGATVAVVGWLVLSRPITALVAWIGRVPSLRPLVTADDPATVRSP